MQPENKVPVNLDFLLISCQRDFLWEHALGVGPCRRIHAPPWSWQQQSMSFRLRLKLCQQRPCDVLLLLVLEEGFQICQTFLIIDQLVPQKTSLLYIYIIYIMFLYKFTIPIPYYTVVLFFHLSDRVFFGESSTNVPNAAVEVRERHLCATTSWVEAAQRGTWRWWWTNEGYGQDHGRDDGMMFGMMMGWWLRLHILSLLVSKCPSVFLVGSCRLKWPLAVDFFSDSLESFRSEPFWSISR